MISPSHHRVLLDVALVPTGPVAVVPKQSRGLVAAWSLVLGVQIGIVVVVFFAMLLGCASFNAAQAPQRARVALAKIGVAYSALAAAHEAAVEIRVAQCKAKGLGPEDSSIERVRCMGELGSQGALTLGLIELKSLYDEGADVLTQMAALLEQLTAELAAARKDGG